MDQQITYKIANSAQEFMDGRKLFEEYVQSIDVDLSFQGFAEELQTIDQQYNKPSGALILALDGKSAIGCCGIRQLEHGIAELKRMYVNPRYRNGNIGSALLSNSLAVAKELGYQKIRLDTLNSMTKAKKLYAAFGFYEIAPYRFNPLAGTVYMEKALQ